jgi:cytidylate kinase
MIMLEAPSAESMKRYMQCQIQRAEKESQSSSTHPRAPFLTVSRQAGAGGITIGQKVVRLSNVSHNRVIPCPWTVFDRNLVDIILDHHDLPEVVGKYMPEDKRSEFADTIEELLGLHPSSMVMKRKTAETILHLAQMGHAVIVGRGANIITRKLSRGFHVRLVSSMEKRVNHIAAYHKIDEKAAKAFVDKEDKGRAEYIKNHFGKNIDDPLLYDMVLNTDRMTYDQAAQLIADAVHRVQQ